VELVLDLDEHSVTFTLNGRDRKTITDLPR
jgi:hypothetical protein